MGTYYANLNVSKIRVRDNSGFKFVIVFFCIATLLVMYEFFMIRELSQWCIENVNTDGGQWYVGRGYGHDDAPYAGFCPSTGKGKSALPGSTARLADAEVFTIAQIVSYGCSFVTLFSIWAYPPNQWKCGHCLKKLREENLVTKSKLTVISTSNTTKQITTLNSQAGAGIHGSQTVSFTSTGSSTSHVPIVLGRISAIYQCKSRTCGKSNQWQFDSEVQVWIDRSTGGETHDVIGGVVLPQCLSWWQKNG